MASTQLEILEQPPPADGAARSMPLAQTCQHCGAPCPDRAPSWEEKLFCCHGCKTVYQILAEHGLAQFYELDHRPGIRLEKPIPDGRFDYLDDEAVRNRLLDFSDAHVSRVTFRVPAMHCVACVWLLENLFRLHEGIGRSQVNFPRKEVAISFEHARISLGGLAATLAGLGYEPALSLTSMEPPPLDPAARRLYLQVGVAGFSFGNIMLFSLCQYFGLDAFSGPAFARLFGYVSILLALPVLIYSAADYWQGAWRGLCRRVPTIDLPIALGIVALFGQSLYEILFHAGGGYLDSFTGLVFLLLCGKIFQRKTYDRLSFDLDYTAYFPLSVVRRRGDRQTSVPIMSIDVGDQIVVRNRELIPADSRLVHGPACIDYSFVTGESTPVQRKVDDYIYAGGRQVGPAIVLETVKSVSQSYLTSLWNEEAFRDEGESGLDTLTNRIGRYFTAAVILIAACAGGYWMVQDPMVAVRAFTSVLIVACPCALALSAPFALGTAVRALGRGGLYVRNTHVIERMARIRTAIFDKTGTLTSGSEIDYTGEPLSDRDKSRVRALASQSVHPHSLRIAEALMVEEALAVSHFEEHAGCGLVGTVDGQVVHLGSSAWLREAGITVPGDVEDQAETGVCVALGKRFRGSFRISNKYRPGLGRMAARLGDRCDLVLLSGDHDREEARLRQLLGRPAQLLFRQSPLDKLRFVRAMQAAGKRVLMLGDGLNDAGALKQSDVGMAVSEDIGTFSPACDAILDADRLMRVPDYLRCARSAMRVVVVSFAISFAYNVVGISFAARGLLSPLVSAILMPLSSVSVIIFAVGATAWVTRRMGGSSA